MTKKGNGRKPSSTGGSEGRLRMGGILKGLADLVEKLDELAESGGEISKSGEILGERQQVKGIYGYTVKVGLGGQEPRVEPFGNIHQDRKSGRMVVEDVREPVVDVFDEEGHVLVVAEMPGIRSGDVRLEIEEDLLTVSAERGDKKYRKEVLLPQSFSREQIQMTCHSGVVEIKCLKSH